jgi:hypothetical protein
MESLNTDIQKLHKFCNEKKIYNLSFNIKDSYGTEFTYHYHLINDEEYQFYRNGNIPTNYCISENKKLETFDIKEYLEILNNTIYNYNKDMILLKYLEKNGFIPYTYKHGFAEVEDVKRSLNNNITKIRDVITCINLECNKLKIMENKR